MLEWNEKFSVGVKKIDDQHQIFFDLINKLEGLTSQKNFLDSLPRLLNEIVEYATLHFKTEEKLMAEISFPNLTKHHELHETIKKDIYLECKKVIEKEPTTMDIIWLYNYLKEWVKTHILEEDRKYIPYVNKKHK